MKVKLLSRVRLFATRGLQPTKLLCPWDSPGKNTGVGCHFLLQGHTPISDCKCTQILIWGDFPESSVGKESACNAGDPSLIPGSGRSAGEGISYPLQYSWASIVAQLVKNQPPTWETQVQSLSWEDPWRRERLPNPVFWPEEFHGLRPWGRKESDTTEQLSLQEWCMGAGPTILLWLKTNTCGTTEGFDFWPQESLFVCFLCVLLTSQPIHVQVYHLLMY